MQVVKDLIAARLAQAAPILFGVEGVSLHDLEGERPRVRLQHQGMQHDLECDYIAGCDGFHGVSRPTLPAAAIQVHQRVYPFAWLGPRSGVTR